MIAWLRRWWEARTAPQPANLRRGRAGEDAAARYLAGVGWKILARNYTTALGELDLVAWNGECMAFVEVKARSSGSWGRPADAVDREKRRRVTAAAMHYLRAAGTPLVRIRFDIVEVLLSGDDVAEVRHLEDAFRMEGGRTYP
ncbi:MAG: YraN family protein [Verrucomicrobiota bacterium]